MPEPRHSKGTSKQDYQTPPEFLAAVKAYLGIPSFLIDLAASAENTAAEMFYTKGDNALVQPWNVGGEGWAWLNPPFAQIGPWVKKAQEESERFSASIAMLLPAGIGSNWFRDYVHKKAYWLALNGRLTFVGSPTCYPKDCILILWGSERQGIPQIGYDIWSWNAT